MNAQDILDRIAPSKAAFTESLFKPVSFSDGASGTYSGFIERQRTRSVDLVWCSTPLTINAHGVICSRSKTGDGRTWYGYTLNPFGEMRYSEECRVATLLLEKFSKRHAPAVPA